jgi:hypothetical protein
MLAKSCLDAKLKYGCAVWNKLNKTQVKELNLIKINTFKRIMQLPYSTPSAIVQYEFGIIGIDLEVLMEKVLLYFEVLKGESIGQRLLTSMLSYSVPGFCHEVIEALKILDMHGNDVTYLSFDKVKLRDMCKARLVKLQGDRLIEDMISTSKSDSILLQEFMFDGKMKDYLYQLPFEQARIVFMLRARMFPTKLNFKGRWENDECEFCRIPQNDKHLFSCPAYVDLTEGLIYMDIIGLNLEMDKLYEASVRMQRVKERLEVFNK